MLVLKTESIPFPVFGSSVDYIPAAALSLQKSIKLHLVFPHVVWLQGHIKYKYIKKKVSRTGLTLFPVSLKYNHIFSVILAVLIQLT